MEHETMEYVWLVGIGGSNLDEVMMHLYAGTKFEVKQYLAKLIKENAKIAEFDYVVDSYSTMETIEERTNNHIYGYLATNQFHLDFSAHPINLDDYKEFKKNL